MLMPKAEVKQANDGQESAGADWLPLHRNAHQGMYKLTLAVEHAHGIAGRF